MKKLLIRIHQRNSTRRTAHNHRNRFSGLAHLVLIGLAAGLALQVIWNYLLQGLFDLNSITYPQAFGIIATLQLVSLVTLSRRSSHRIANRKYLPGVDGA
jgi:hypothetical protein